MSNLTTAVEWLRGQLMTFGKQAATYSRAGGVGSPWTLNVIPSQPRRESATEQGSTIASNTVDFLIDGSSMEQGPGVPRVGDEINLNENTYRVRRSPADDNEFYRYVDASRTLMRIHTIQVGT